jgi:hypothetical protein
VTEDLALRCGQLLGGLINATFGNVVEVILSLAALQQASALLLLALGMRPPAACCRAARTSAAGVAALSECRSPSRQHRQRHVKP